MYRVDHFTGSRTLEPTTAPLTNDGLYFTAGNPGVGGVGVVAATVVEPEWLNTIQEELCNIIAAGDEDLDKNDRAQLARCIYTVSHPSGGGPVGPRMIEPPATGKPYARYWNGTDLAGQWIPAMEEPPDDGRSYSRMLRTVGGTGEWVLAVGSQRAEEDTDFHVEKAGSDETGDGSEQFPWFTIQHAVNVICSSWDAGWNEAEGRPCILTIRVGNHLTTPWDGFIVTQPVLNAARMGFRIIGTDDRDNRGRCIIRACTAASGYSTYCVYVNGGRVSIGGFRFDQAAAVPMSGTTFLNYGGASVCCEGGDSTLWFECDPTALVPAPCSFHPNGANMPCLLASQHGLIIIDDYILLAGGLYGELANPPPSSVQDNTRRGIFVATLCGQIQIEDVRNELGVIKAAGAIRVESAIRSPGANAVGGAVPGGAWDQRILYCGNGGIINFGETGQWLYLGGTPPPPTVVNSTAAAWYTIRTTGQLGAGARPVKDVMLQVQQNTYPRNYLSTGGVISTQGGQAADGGLSGGTQNEGAQ